MIALLALLSTADATELSLSWSEEPVRYHGELLLDIGEAVWMLSRNNINARARTVTIVADFTCRGAESGRNWSVDCVVDQIEMGAEPFTERERERVNEILQEYTELITYEHVEMIFGADGRMKSIDVEGVPKNDERAREIQELLRLFMRRMFVPFEHQLPRRGSAEVGQTWAHRGTAANIEVFSKFGTIGGTRVEYTLAESTDGVHAIASSGYGTVGVSNAGSVAVTGGGSVGSTNESSSATNISTTSSLYSATGAGMAWLDESLGWWSYAESIVQADRNQATPPIVFLHAAWLGRILPDGTVVRPPPAEETE